MQYVIASFDRVIIIKYHRQQSTYICTLQSLPDFLRGSQVTTTDDMKLFRPSPFLLLLFLLLFLLSLAAEAKDLYKVLGVDKNASQRDIQKAFHKMSLKYHPDKNPSKNAQEKFSEINNAYEVLSDEEKRKNYDLFGDEQGRSRGPDASTYDGYEQNRGYAGSGGWSQSGSKGWSFSYSSNDHNGYRSRQQFRGDDDSYGQGSFFNFPFESHFAGQGRPSFTFDGHQSAFGNIFDSFFGTAQGRQSDSTSYTTGKTKKNQKGKMQDGNQFNRLTEQLTPENFVATVLDQFYTWAILFTPHVSREFRMKLELIEKISGNLHNSLKVGYVDCEKYSDFCKEYQMWPIKAPKLRLYYLRSIGKLGTLDYFGGWSERDIKSYCIEALPKFSKHVENMDALNTEVEDVETTLRTVLLTRKKAAPAMWRVLSGLFYGRIHFFDLQVNDKDVPAISKKFKVDSFPAIIGIYPDGKSEVLADGNRLDQSSVSVDDLKSLLEGLEKNSKSRGSEKTKSKDMGEVISLSKKNMGTVCGPETALCIIGVYKSSKGMEKVKPILKEISQKTLIRRQTSNAHRKPISFCVLDGARHSSFLSSFNDGLSKKNSVVLIAYKPKKGTFAFFDGPLTIENVENFVVQILGGDCHLDKVARDPILS